MCYGDSDEFTVIRVYIAETFRIPCIDDPLLNPYLLLMILIVQHHEHSPSFPSLQPSTCWTFRDSAPEAVAVIIIMRRRFIVSKEETIA